MDVVQSIGTSHGVKCLKFYDSASWSNTFAEQHASEDAMDAESVPKPTLEEVLRYAEGNIRKAIALKMGHLPKEQQEEAASEARLQVIEAYQRLDADRGWRSFIYTRAVGTVLDYVKTGAGFEEDRRRAQRQEPMKFVERLRERVMLANEDQENDIDLIAGLNGVADEFEYDGFTGIKWDLVARIARKNDMVHAMAMWLRGWEPSEIAMVLEVTPARVGQLLRQFVDFVQEFTTKESTDPMEFQIIYAFGLARLLGVEEKDQSLVFGLSLGWDQPPVDLDSLEPKYSGSPEQQLSFFNDAI